jgi:competence protein ComFB
MEIHNVSEDIVFNSIKTIFESIKKGGNPEGLCLCEQCKLDTICYALNRIEPRYTISNRGIARIEQDWIGRHQTEADIATLIYKGIRLVNHNMRPTALHEDSESNGIESKESNEPVFDIPKIIGRIFNGETFEPLTGATVELRCNGRTLLPSSPIPQGHLRSGLRQFYPRQWKCAVFSSIHSK